MMPGMSNNDFIRYLLSGGSQGAGKFGQSASVGPNPMAFQPPQQAVPQPQAANVPMPPQRPAQAATPAAKPQKPAGQPMSLAPPYPGPGMSFSGEKGPQWTDAQWQNYWNRSNPDGLMSYYPVQE